MSRATSKNAVHEKALTPRQCAASASPICVPAAASIASGRNRGEIFGPVESVGAATAGRAAPRTANGSSVISPGRDDCFLAAGNLLQLRVIEFDDEIGLRELLLVAPSGAFIDMVLNRVHGLLP